MTNKQRENEIQVSAINSYGVKEQFLLNLYEVELQHTSDWNRVKWSFVAKDEYEAFKKATQQVRRKHRSLRVIQVTFIKELTTECTQPLPGILDELRYQWDANKGSIATFVVQVVFFPIVAISTSIYYMFYVVRELVWFVLDVLVSFFVALRGLFTRQKQVSQTRLISDAPGARLLSIVDFLYSSKTVELTFKPLVHDLRSEYFEALRYGQVWKARWIRVRYCYSFIAAMGLSKALSFLKELRSASNSTK